MLLQIAQHCKVIKEGIKYLGRVYWHESLLDHVCIGDDILIRSAPKYTHPDEIQVYAQGQWICSAFARDSALGKEVTGRQVAGAQRGQRAKARLKIKGEQAMLQATDKEIAQRQAEQESLPLQQRSEIRPLQPDEIAPPAPLQGHQGAMAPQQQEAPSSPPGMPSEAEDTIPLATSPKPKKIPPPRPERGKTAHAAWTYLVALEDQ